MDDENTGSYDLRPTDRAMLVALSHRQGDRTPLSFDQERLLDSWVAGRLSSIDADRAADLAKHNAFAAERVLEHRLISAANEGPGVPGPLARRVLRASRSPATRTTRAFNLRWPTFSGWQWSGLGALTAATVAIAFGLQFWPKPSSTIATMEVPSPATPVTGGPKPSSTATIATRQAPRPGTPVFDGPTNPTDVARSVGNPSKFDRAQGRYADAERLIDLGAAPRWGKDDPVDVRQEVTQLYQHELVLYQQGHFSEALPLAQRALNIAEKGLVPDHPVVAAVLNNLAMVYGAQGRYADAELLYKRSLAIREKALGPDHPAVADSLNRLAELDRAQGRYADAEPLYKRSLAIREKALGPDHPAVADSLNDLALDYEALGRYADAEALYKRSLAIDEKAFGPDHPDVAKALSNLASLYEAQGRYADAEPLYKRSLAIRERAFGADHQPHEQQLQPEQSFQIAMVTLENRSVLAEGVRATRGLIIMGNRIEEPIISRFRDISIPTALLQRAITSASNNNGTAEHAELMNFLHSQNDTYNNKERILIDSALAASLSKQLVQRDSTEVRVYDLDDPRAGNIRNKIEPPPKNAHFLFLTVGQ